MRLMVLALMELVDAAIATILIWIRWRGHHPVGTVDYCGHVASLPNRTIFHAASICNNSTVGLRFSFVAELTLLFLLFCTLWLARHTHSRPTRSRRVSQLSLYYSFLYIIIPVCVKYSYFSSCFSLLFFRCADFTLVVILCWTRDLMGATWCVRNERIWEVERCCCRAADDIYEFFYVFFFRVLGSSFGCFNV